MDEQVAALMRANLHEVFGQRDPQARDDAAGRTYTDDVVFADEDGAVTGRKALVARASGLLGSVPADFAFTEDGPLYQGTGTAALAWRFGPPTGEPAARGVDIATITGGRISRLQTLLVR